MKTRRSAKPPAVIVFDLDGTLLRGTTVSLLLAEWLGRGEEIARLEDAFRDGRISNSVVADTSAGWFAGVELAAVWRVLRDGPWIAGMAEALRELSSAGAQLLLGTVTWKFVAAMLAEHYGFAAVSGTEMQVQDGMLSGTVSRYFDEFDKAAFGQGWCAQNGFSLSDVLAIGDSRSDVPLFECAGRSIALNATPDARAVATRAIDAEDLRDLLSLPEFALR
jgi:phosphoserine phosphatase